jgi:hypothetical protein
MKKIYLLSAFLGLSVLIKAQRISYTLLEDNPQAINQLYIRLNPLYFEGFKTNTASIGRGIEIRYLLKDMLIFNFNNNVSYSTIQENNNNDKFAIRDLSVEYILSDKSKSKDVKINLSSSTSGNVTYSKYVTVPGTTRYIFAARGGVLNYKSPFKIGELSKAVKTTILDEEGYKTKGFEPSASIVRSTSIFAGLSYSIINNTRIKVDGMRKIKSNERWLNLYADVLFSPLIKIDDFEATNENNKISNFVVNDVFEKQRIGLRTGFLVDYHTNKNVTFGGRAEIGSRPGIKGYGFYLYCGMGMTISLIKNKTS